MHENDNSDSRTSGRERTQNLSPVAKARNSTEEVLLSPPFFAKLITEVSMRMFWMVVQLSDGLLLEPQKNLASSVIKHRIVRFESPPDQTFDPHEEHLAD